MKKFNKSKIIIPALAMIALTTAASATGTVAWFTANTVTAVSGMSFTAKASSNLLIAGDTLTGNTRKTDDNFSEDLSQIVNGDLHPVSTIDGLNYYYTAQAAANGDSIDLTSPFYTLNIDPADNEITTNADAITSTKYDTIGNNSDDTKNKKGFLEYVFQLKAVNVAATNQKINISSLNLTYATSASDTEGANGTSLAHGNTAKAVKAYRVAFFVQDITTATVTNIGTLSQIYGQSGAAYFTKDNSNNPQAIDAIGDEGSTAAPTMGNVSEYGTATSLATVAASSTAYYKVVARLWLEGEDTTCNNTAFLGLDQNWAFNMELTLTNADASVSNITTVVTDTKNNKKSTNGGEWAAIS